MGQPSAQTCHLHSTIKDSFTLKETIDTWWLPPDAFLFTSNAVSMYTYIQTEPALQAISEYLCSSEGHPSFIMRELPSPKPSKLSSIPTPSNLDTPTENRFLSQECVYLQPPLDNSILHPTWMLLPTRMKEPHPLLQMIYQWCLWNLGPIFLPQM